MEHNIASVQNASASRRNSKTSEKLLGDQSISLPIDSNEEKRRPSPTTSKCIMIFIGLGITAILVIATIYATVSSMNAKGKSNLREIQNAILTRVKRFPKIFFNLILT